MPKSTLHLLPNLLAEDTWNLLPKSLETIVSSLDGLICEHEKEGRKYLKALAFEKMRTTPLYIVDEHTKDTDLDEIVSVIERGKLFGMISDAGLPLVADPGSRLVQKCRRKKIQIKATLGPNSILHALLLSGFSGQAFSFHGYLPRKEDELILALQKLESFTQYGTQIWIEAPYRTDKMIKACLETLHPKTQLAVAKNLTSNEEEVFVHSIQTWRDLRHKLGKVPSVFLLSSSFS